MDSEILNLQGASILVVDDTDANRAVLCRLLDGRGFQVAAVPSGEIALRLAAKEKPELILLDVVMPGLDGFETCRQLKENPVTSKIPVVYITAKDETRDVVEGFRAGGVDYITKPFREEEVAIRIDTHLKNHRLVRALQDEVDRRRRAEQAFEKADRQLSRLSEQEARRWGVSGFIGHSQAFLQIVETIRRLQQYPKTNVMIQGESGVGKELIARAIHYGGTLARGPFVPVNCSAIPRDLGESVFFGHVKGAFSGATADHQGYFEQADGGTLFLDEVGDMPIELQVKLLRVIEDGTVQPVGSSRPGKKIEVRVLSGTNAELQSSIQLGSFRKDLYFRLAGFALDVPPLRERPEDIPLLARFFSRKLSDEMGMPAPNFSVEAIEKLEAYSFPGNIRELRNIIERALIEGAGMEISGDHIHCLEIDSIMNQENLGKVNIDGAVQTRPLQFASGSDEERILGYAAQNDRITNPECRQLLDVGVHRASYLLRKLATIGALTRINVGKATEYRIS